MVIGGNGQTRKTTHLDRVTMAVEGSPARMVILDVPPESTYTYALLDQNGLKVGEVRFAVKDESFLGGTFYGKMAVVGRTNNAGQACTEYEKLIEEIHERR